MNRFVLVPHAPELGWWYVADTQDYNRCIGEILDSKHFNPGHDYYQFGSSDLREIADLLDGLKKPVDPT